MEKRKFPDTKISIIVELNTYKHSVGQGEKRTISQTVLLSGRRNIHIHIVFSRAEQKEFLIFYNYQ